MQTLLTHLRRFSSQPVLRIMAYSWLISSLLHSVPLLSGASLLDTTFRTFAPYSIPLDIELQPDGKLLVVGNFSEYDDKATDGIVRLNKNGQVDTNFVASKSGGQAVDARVVALAPDGKIYLGGTFSKFRGHMSSGIVRLNSDGSVDQSFSYVVEHPLPVSGIYIQTDGKILVADTQKLNRLSPEGMIDPSFAFSYETNETMTAGALLPDGKFLISLLSLNDRLRVLRLNTDGTVDSFFSLDARIRSAGSSSRNMKLFPLTDGHIIIAGGFVGARLSVARLNANGSLDESFDAGWVGFPSTAIIRPDGKIIIGGQFVGGLGNRTLAQLLPDGAIDLGFKVAIADTTISDLALQPDGKLIVAGDFGAVDGVDRARIARLNVSAASDLNILSLGTTAWIAESAGKTMATVRRVGDRQNRVSVSCLTTNGTALAFQDYVPVASQLVFEPGEWEKQIEIEILDNAVADGGRDFKLFLAEPHSLTGALSLQDSTASILIEDDESGISFMRKTYEVGESEEAVELGVYLSKGPSNSTVDYEVIAQTAQPGQDFVQQSGTLVFDDWWQDYGYRTFTIPILDDAALDGDKTFLVRLKNPSGTNLIGPIATATITIRDNDNFAGAFKGLNGSIATSIGFKDGKVLIGGWFTSVDGLRRSYLAKLNADGSADRTFDTTDGPNAPVLCLSTQADGKILAGGRFTAVGATRCGHIARFNVDGSLDRTFKGDPGWSGPSFFVYRALPAEIRSILPLRDGKILTAGTMTNYGDVQRFGLCQLNADGSLDESFNPPLTPGTGITALGLQPDQKILIGGTFRGNNLQFVGRLFPDGSFDPSFAVTNIATVNAFLPRPDGTILVGTGMGLSHLNTNGFPVSDFSQQLYSESVLCFLPQADGTVWAGGDFWRKKVGILSLSTNLTISALDGGLGFVRTLAFQGDHVFAAGTFNGWDSEDMEQARIDPTFGAIMIPQQPDRYFWKQFSLTGSLIQRLRFDKIVASGVGIDLSLSGQSQSPFRVEKSSDLKTWVPVFENKTPNSGMIFRDPVVGSGGRNFYRATSSQ